MTNFFNISKKITSTTVAFQKGQVRFVEDLDRHLVRIDIILDDLRSGDYSFYRAFPLLLLSRALRKGLPRD